MSSIAEQLLAGLTEDQIEAYTADMATEEHIIVNADRTIVVPDDLKRIAVQFDHDVETVIFDCPRYWDEHDMSQMKIYINYMRSDKVVGMFWAKNVVVDETDDNIMHFTWTVSRNVTEAAGKIAFLVCVKKTDSEGMEVNHWNSELCEDMYVSEGLECEEAVMEPYPDIITDLLLRMDYVEDIATPESMQEYVSKYFTTEKGQKELKEHIYNYMINTDPTSEEFMAEFVSMYLDKNPPLFVIGDTKPNIKCLWFNTSGVTGGTSEPGVSLVTKMTSDGDSGMYALVDEVGKTTDYDFEIE